MKAETTAGTPWPAPTSPRNTTRASGPFGLAPEALALAVVALLVLLANQPFWQAALQGHAMSDPSTWRFIAVSAVMLTGLHLLPLLLLATRHTLRPLLALLIVTSLVAQHLMQRYGVVLDPPMLRNALHTHRAETAELLTPALLGQGLLGLGLAALLWRVPLRRRGWRRTLLWRGAMLAAVLTACVGALALGFQDLASTMRNDRALRYRITPGNVLYSAGRALAGDIRVAHQAPPPLLPIDRVGPQLKPHKPRLLVLVVGETARAMNFSLNGYARPTNPELATLPVINFPDTRACGTSTEVSLPCLFSPLGRAGYDEARIRGGESLLQLLARAGLRVVWLDNQSGCKGVCTGLDSRDLSEGSDPVLCPDGHCHDEVLLHGLQQVLGEAASASVRDTVVVLHQIGNHGPAYFRRYPAGFARFGPACTSHELRDCSRAQIVNAYDNAILYTDHLLAATVRLLAGEQTRWDVGMMYVSDHGESLGEKGLYLHGMPEALAPREQHAVPMLWWFGGEGATGWRGLDATCLRTRAGQSAHHDNLYHSVLGLLDLRTSAYVAARDLISPCRDNAATSSARAP